MNCRFREGTLLWLYWECRSEDNWYNLYLLYLYSKGSWEWTDSWILLGMSGWSQYLQLNEWVCSMNYLQLWKKNCVSKLFLWSYFTAHWKECFLWNFKLISRFINRLISVKLKGLNEWLIVIDGLLSGVLMLSKCSILSAAQKILFSRMPSRCLCTEKSSKNLLKTAKTECAWIITLNFNCNRKFLINKNMYLNMLKAAEIDEH